MMRLLWDGARLYVRVTTLFLIGLLFLSGCAPRHLERPGWQVDLKNIERCDDLLVRYASAPHELNTVMDKRVRRFQSQVEEQLILRQKSGATIKIMLAADGRAPLPPAELKRLKEIIGKSLVVNQHIFMTAVANDCWLKVKDDTHKAPLLQKARQKGVMLALSAALVLYDSYLHTVSILTEDERIRRFANQSDIGFGVESGQLTSFTRFYESFGNRMLIRRLTAAYHEQLQEISTAGNPSDEYRYLQMLIEQSPSYYMLQKRPIESPHFLTNKIKRDTEDVADSLYELQQNAVGGLSQIFGNSVGLVETRKGKLHDDEDIKQRVLNSLQPGDILLEKTPFRLTDTFIPGHWGHAAIWIGHEDQLKSLGVWDHPLVAQHKKAVKERQSVVEALRDGVQMNSLTDFMNIDDLAVLRQHGLEPSRQSEIILQALRQVGKDYDFNFDVESTDTIVCSELVYQVYTDVEWPTDKVVGRFTISPDNVALKAIENGPFKTVLLYHDGKEVRSGIDRFMGKLLSNSKQPFARISPLN